MFVIYILIIVIIFLIVAHIINHRAMQSKLDSERYAKDQVIRKMSTIKQENTQLKIKYSISMRIRIRIIMVYAKHDKICTKF